jgi:hypothetical protein
MTNSNPNDFTGTRARIHQARADHDRETEPTKSQASGDISQLFLVYEPIFLQAGYTGVELNKH